MKNIYDINGGSVRTKIFYKVGVKEKWLKPHGYGIQEILKYG